MGFLDSLDIVHFIASMVTHGHVNVLHIQRLIREESAIKISNLAKRHPFTTVNDGDSIMKVLELMKVELNYTLLCSNYYH